MKPIRKALAMLGVGSSYKGCEQLELALRLVMEEGYTLTSARAVYKEVARRMGVSCDSVERNVRTIINRAWDVDQEWLEEMAGYPLELRPSGAEFMTILSNYIQQFLPTE